MGKNGKKVYGKKGKIIHFPLFPYTVFPFFPMGKNGKTYIFPWAKMGLDPPPPINTNKACGPDEIPGIVLKMCSISLALPLSIIYNQVYNTGSLPLQWKLSNIVPTVVSHIYTYDRAQNILNFVQPLQNLILQGNL